MAAIQGIHALLAKGQGEEAQLRLGAAERKYARDPHFLLMRAEQAMRSRNLRAAEADYRRAADLAPKLYVTQLNHARFLDLAKGDVAAARARYETAAKLAPQRPEVWRHYAAFQFRQGQHDEALASLRKLKALDPTASLPERRVAELSAAAGRYTQARDWFIRAKAQNPSDAEMQAIRLALGDTLLRLKRYPEARAEIQAALKVQETAPPVFALATIDEAEGRLDAAERGYRRTLELMPGNPLAANNLAMLFVRAGRNSREALGLADQARRAIPGNAIVEGTWGCALSANGRGKEALEALKPVVQATPKDPWVHYCLGKELVAERQVKDGLAHLQQTLQLDAAFPRREEVTRLIQKVR
jgi:tetratricopeptide (TPR) repeat protein